MKGMAAGGEVARTSAVRMCTSLEAGHHLSDGVSAPGEVLVAACASACDSALASQLASQLAAMYLRHEA